MNTAILLLALVPTQIGRGREERPSNIRGINPRFEIGPRVQNRIFSNRLPKVLIIRGSGNIVYFSTPNTDNSFNYYRKRKFVFRPFFRRFRRTYP